MKLLLEAPSTFCEVNSLAKASGMCRRWIYDTHSTAEDWTGGYVYAADESENPIAYVSYNAKIWDSNNHPHSKEILNVVIPSRTQHEGFPGYAVTVALIWHCPVCGGLRGVPGDGISYDGSRMLAVNVWKNDCGHVDIYSSVRVEAAQNGLNPSLALE
jgi:hypothetical protein